MSRIGRAPITIPQGVSVKLDGNTVSVNGPKGTLSREIDSKIKVEINSNVLSLTRPDDESDTKAKHGLYRALINNMVTGVVSGFTRKLIVNGVGYKCSKSGTKLVLNIGFSHSIELEIPEGLNVELPLVTEIVISGADKEKVGQFAAKIRALKPVEPYHLYGIRYDNEVVIKKAGKTSGKGAGKK